MLVTAKTYPVISNRYNETVCTAGITSDGAFVRIYPICYRSLPKQQRFKKYQWISFEAIKDERDPRKESYKLVSDIVLDDVLTTKKQWIDRREVVLSSVQFDLKGIIRKAYDTKGWRSLFVFKPMDIVKFNVTDCSANDNMDRKREMLLHRLEGVDSLIEDIPYRFSYTFKDSNGNLSTLGIIDWEIYELTRKLIRIYKNNFEAISSILTDKYFADIACKRDVYFFLGTNKYWHIRKSKNPFMIIGIFYPPKLD